MKINRAEHKTTFENKTVEKGQYYGYDNDGYPYITNGKLLDGTKNMEFWRKINSGKISHWEKISRDNSLSREIAKMDQIREGKTDSEMTLGTYIRLIQTKANRTASNHTMPNRHKPIIPHKTEQLQFLPLKNGEMIHLDLQGDCPYGTPENKHCNLIYYKTFLKGYGRPNVIIGRCSNCDRNYLAYEENADDDEKSGMIDYVLSANQEQSFVLYPHANKHDNIMCIKPYKHNVYQGDIELPYVKSDAYHDQYDLDKTMTKLVLKNNQSYVIPCRKCSVCGDIFIRKNLKFAYLSDQKIKTMFKPTTQYMMHSNYRMKETLIEQTQSVQTIYKENVGVNTPSPEQVIQTPLPEVKPDLQTYSIGKKEFLTRTYSCDCIMKDHVLEDILCIVWMKLHRGVIERMEIPAMRCLTCGKYYIHEDQYQKYRAMGRFICQIVRREYWLDPDSSEIETCRFYPTSLLMDCGYTVKASIGVPEEVRRRILRDVVDSGLMTRFQIVSHIRQQMDIHWDCREAIDKWRGDMEYIAEYKKEELDKVEANAFLLSIYRK